MKVRIGVIFIFLWFKCVLGTSNLVYIQVIFLSYLVTRKILSSYQIGGYGWLWCFKIWSWILNLCLSLVFKIIILLLLVMIPPAHRGSKGQWTHTYEYLDIHILVVKFYRANVEELTEVYYSVMFCSRQKKKTVGRYFHKLEKPIPETCWSIWWRCRVGLQDS